MIVHKQLKYFDLITKYPFLKDYNLTWEIKDFIDYSEQFKEYISTVDKIFLTQFELKDLRKNHYSFYRKFKNEFVIIEKNKCLQINICV